MNKTSSHLRDHKTKADIEFENGMKTIFLGFALAGLCLLFVFTVKFFS